MKIYIPAMFMVVSATLHASTERPNILFIVSEDNGPELGCYGDQYAKTPNLDKLANEGVRFDNAFVPYSVCSPSRAAFYTGMYPHQNGQLGLQTHKFRMYAEYPWIGSYLKSIGYHIGLVGKLHVDPSARFEREWDYRTITGANFNASGRDMSNYATAAENFFTQAGDKPFFLTINYPDAHFPVHDQAHGLPVNPQTGDDVEPLSWIGVTSPRIKDYMAGYYNCMSRLDSGVGMLIDKLKASGKYENTLIIYIGDHGAQFSRGKTSCYEAAIRVPLIVHWNGKVTSRVVTEELVSTIDILPTILQATGLDVPDYLPGKPLQPLMEGHTGGHDLIASFTSGSAPSILCVQNSFRSKRWKLIHTIGYSVENRSARGYLNASGHFEAGCTTSEIATAPQYIQDAYDLYLNPPDFELYDLKNDKDEFINLADKPEYAETLEEMKTQMRDWQIKYNDPFRDPALGQQFVDEQMLYIDNSGHKTSGFRWDYVDLFTPFGPDVTSGETLINGPSDLFISLISCGFEVTDGFDDGAGSTPANEVAFSNDSDQNYISDSKGNRWTITPELKAFNTNMVGEGVSGLLSLGDETTIEIELNNDYVNYQEPGGLSYSTKLGNAFSDGATWTVYGFDVSQQSWVSLQQKTTLDTAIYQHTIALDNLSSYSKYKFVIAATEEPKSLHFDSIVLSPGIYEDFSDLTDGSPLATAIGGSSLTNPVTVTLHGVEYSIANGVAFNAKDHSGQAPNLMLNGSTFVGGISEIPTEDDLGTFSYISWKCDSQKRLDSIKFGIRSSTKSKLINHALQSFSNGAWTTIPNATWSRKVSSNDAYTKEFKNLSLPNTSQIRLITWADADIDLGVGASIDDLLVRYRQKIDSNLLVGDFNQHLQSVVWKPTNENLSKSFQLVNSETGEVIDTIVVRDINGNYSAEVPEGVTVRLEIVDINGESHVFTPSVIVTELLTPISIENDWNLLSVPGMLMNLAVLTEEAENPNLWVWEDGQYQLVTNSLANRGCWLYSNSEFEFTLRSHLSTEDKIVLDTGWNLIGPTEENQTFPDTITLVFHWADGKYVALPPESPLEFGKGYWVFNSSDETENPF